MSKFTSIAIQKAEPGEILRDDQVPGLHAKVFANRVSFYLYFRTPDKKERRPKIGDFGAINIQQAREIAREWLFKNAKGEEVKPRLQPLQRLTIACLHKQWHKEHRHHLKPNSQRSQDHHWNNYILPYLGNILLLDLERRDIYSMFEQVSKKAPVMANRVLSTLSNGLNLAEEWGWRKPNSNPCCTIRGNKESQRKRYLTPEELQRLGTVLLEWEKKGSWWRKSSRFIRLLMITGARKNEIAYARREWIDFDAQLLRLPDSKTGAKEVGLPNAAMRLIQQIIQEEPDSEWLCSGFHKTDRLENPYFLWKKMKKEAGISDLKLHDLRHSFASVGLSFQGMNLRQVGLLLGHSNESTTARYAHLMQTQHVELSNAIANTIENLMSQPLTIEDICHA